MPLDICSIIRCLIACSVLFCHPEFTVDKCHAASCGDWITIAQGCGQRVLEAEVQSQGPEWSVLG